MSNQGNSSSASGLPHLNTGFDGDDESFIDFSQTYTPTTASPAINHSFPPSSSSFMNPQHLPGPSFQYDNYKQQTGLPIGGLANTIAVNQATGMQYTGAQSGFVMPTETLNMPLSHMEEFDFGRDPSFDADMDFEDDSPADLPTMFYPSAASSSKQFVNPTALSSQSDSPTLTAPVQRMYPGMHAQQAAQLKAQQAQKLQEMHSQPRTFAGQRPLPIPSSVPSSSKAPAAKDPHVEESISRLLNQMRHNSVVSADDSSTPTGEDGHNSRSRKDEEDMDEDERLLASEEGKKLSSKERRQLRNKVSARAFRSRRKEYIGQLEGEVAEKTQEANELKAQNRQLMEENTRLTDLTRMLLSSSAFSGFLNELSSNGMSVPNTSTARQSQSQPRAQPTRKDVNPHQAARQMQDQKPLIGMAMIPESNVDYSTMDISSNGWNSGLASNDFQVFSITSLPEVAVFDSAILSGKGSAVSELTSVSDAKICPSLPTLPTFSTVKAVESSANVNDEVSLDKDAFALYFDTPASSTALSANAPAIAPKALYIAMTKTVTEYKEGTAEQLDASCALLQDSCDRLALFTSRLI